jgi:hypothetical protein
MEDHTASASAPVLRWRSLAILSQTLDAELRRCPLGAGAPRARFASSLGFDIGAALYGRGSSFSNATWARAASASG